MGALSDTDLETLAVASVIRRNGTEPHDPDPAPAEADLAGCPALPDAARLDPEIGNGAGEWLDRYIAHARAISPMTPALFHESAGLWLGSVAIARRLKIAMPYGDVYPNLFVLWLASTTLWRKTTGLEVARTLARDAFPHLLAPQDTTPEGFLSDLSGREPANLASLPDDLKTLWHQERNYAAQRGLALDELSGLMAGAGKDYNAGLLEAFLRFYDCDPMYARSTRGLGRVIVRNAYLALLGASTPAAMAPHVMSDRLWSNGWWARFAMLTPDNLRPDWEKPVEEDPETIEKLKHDLRALYDRLPPATWPNPPDARGVILGAGVMTAFDAYNKALSYDLLTSDQVDNRLHGAYGRLPTQALKVATILAALDWRAQDGNAPVISLGHFARAMTIAEGWRSSAHRALLQATESEFNRLQQRIIRQCARYEPDGGATLREIYRNMQDKKPADIQDVVNQLLAVGMLEEHKAEVGPQGGRPSIRYRLGR